MHRLLKTTSRTHSRQSGFTLIELLIVVAIIGFVATIVIVSVVGTDHGQIVRSEADRMIRTVELARRETTMRNELWGIMVELDQYHFVVYDFDSKEWSPIDIRPYADITLEEQLRIRFTTPEENWYQAFGEEGELPDIVIEPTGEMTPFEITIEHSASLVASTFGSDGFGKVSLVVERFDAEPN